MLVHHIMLESRGGEREVQGEGYRSAVRFFYLFQVAVEAQMFRLLPVMVFCSLSSCTPMRPPVVKVKLQLLSLLLKRFLCHSQKLGVHDKE